MRRRELVGRRRREWHDDPRGGRLLVEHARAGDEAGRAGRAARREARAQGARDRAARPGRQALQALVAARKGGLPDVRVLALPRRLPAHAAGARCGQARAEGSLEHADHRRLGRPERRYAGGRQVVPRAAAADWQGALAARDARRAPPRLAPVQHPRQVGARDARDHRARLADLRHRRAGPHPRRLSGVAAQVVLDRARRADPRARERSSDAAATRRRP